MRRFSVKPVFLTGLFSLCLATPVWAQDAKSVWETGFGSLELVVKPNGDTHGVYPNFEGEVYASMNGETHEIDGVWTQRFSRNKCDVEKHGSFYWGHVTWKVTGEKSIDGVWSYCDREKGSAGAWKGTMVKGVSPLSVTLDAK